MTKPSIQDLPSTAALRYFIEAAKYASFSQASQQLHVTQAAISKQIKSLENNLGVALFIREKQRIKLSKSGEIYYKDAVRIITELEKLSTKVRNYHHDIDEINMAIPAAFACRFLIPRLAKLYQKHPEIRLKLNTHEGNIDLSQCNDDIIILFNDRIIDDRFSPFEFNKEIWIVVSSPTFTTQDNLSIRQLEKLALLHFSGKENLWQDWFSSVNRASPAPQTGLVFDRLQLLIQATISGLGIALLPQFMIEKELKSSELKRIHSRPLQKSPQYIMLVANEKLQDEKIIQLKSWLLKIFVNASSKAHHQSSAA